MAQNEIRKVWCRSLSNGIHERYDIFASDGRYGPVSPGGDSLRADLPLGIPGLALSLDVPLYELLRNRGERGLLLP